MREITVNAVTPGDAQTRVSITPDNDNKVWSVAWVDGDMLGACSTDEVSCLTLTSVPTNGYGSFSGEISSDVTSIRLVYPYAAGSVAGTLSKVNLAKQICDMDNPYAYLANENVMISEPINITEQTSFDAVMTHVGAAMQVKLNFDDLSAGSTYDLVQVSLCDVPATGNISLTDGSLTTTNDDIEVDVLNATAIQAGTTYTVNAAILPFSVAAGADVKLSVMLRETTSDNEMHYIKRFATVNNGTGGEVTFAKAQHHSIGATISVGRSNNATLFYTNVKMSGRESQGGEFGSFFDCETDIVYNPCSVKDNERKIDFYIYDQDGGISPSSPANGGKTLKNYKCDGTPITDSGAWGTIGETTIPEGVVTKFRILTPGTESHDDIIRDYTTGNLVLDAASIAEYDIDMPSSSAPTLTADNIGSYLYIHNFETGKYGIMKISYIGEPNEDGRIVEIKFDLAWQGEIYYDYKEPALDGGNADFYRYENIEMNTRESHGGNNESFFDCETGIVYTTCSVAGVEENIEFYVYADNNAVKLYSPDKASSTIGSYKCEDVSVNTNGEWSEYFSGTGATPHETRFEALDVDNADHVAAIAAFEDGSIALTADDFKDLVGTTPCSGTPQIYATIEDAGMTGYGDGKKCTIDKYQYAVIKNNVTGKWGMIKFTSISGEYVDGSSTRIPNVSFDLVWQR